MLKHLLSILFLLIIAFNTKAEDTIVKKNFKFSGLALPSYTPENRWYVSGGLLTMFSTSPKDSNVRISNLYLFGLYSQMNQYRISQGGDIFTKKEKYFINYWLYHSYFPEKIFDKQDQLNSKSFEIIDYKVNFLNISFLKKIANKTFIGPNLTFENVYQVNYNKNGFFDNNIDAGKSTYSLLELGLRFQIDKRNQIINTQKGYFLSSELSNSWQTIKGNYNMFKTDFRFFIPIKSHTLGFQIVNEYNKGVIPYRHLAKLNTRGYHVNQFRDKSATLVQLEGRIKILKWLSISTFTGAGGVGTSLMVLNNYVPFAGGGLRIRLIKQYNMYMRVEYGVGLNNNSNLYFSFTDAF